MSPWAAAGAAVALAFVGWRLRWLTASGAVAAGAVGSAVFWGGGLRGALLLALFFVSSSALTVSRTTPQGGRRDWRQVAANGGWAAVGGLCLPWRPSWGWALLVGGLAAAQADTWATEIGAHARRPPRLITTGASVPRGTSGGVTSLGTVGGVAGALLMAGAAVALGLPRRLGAAALAAGVLGAIADSFIGATLQARYVCPTCDQPTERARHRCGAHAVRRGGLPWLDNDGVNLAATTLGAGGALGLLRVIGL